MTNKLGIAALVAGIIGGLATPVITHLQVKGRERPVFEEPEKAEKSLEEQAQSAFGARADDLNLRFEKSDYLPMATELTFIDKDAKTNFINHLLVPLQKDYRQEIGERGFTFYEILQILGRDTDNSRRGFDVGKITNDEVIKAICNYQEKGKKAFDLDLEPPKYKALENSSGKGPSDVNEAYDQWADAVDSKWESAKEKAAMAKQGYNLAKQQYDRASRLEMLRKQYSQPARKP
jgi:hypothetical protein